MRPSGRRADQQDSGQRLAVEGARLGREPPDERAVLDQAGLRHRQSAASQDEAALRRVDILRLRFEDELPIREIAKRFDIPADSRVSVHRCRDFFSRLAISMARFSYCFPLSFMARRRESSGSSDSRRVNRC